MAKLKTKVIDARGLAVEYIDGSGRIIDLQNHILELHDSKTYRVFSVMGQPMREYTVGESNVSKIEVLVVWNGQA